MKDHYLRLLERDRVGGDGMTRRRLVSALGAIGSAAALAPPLVAGSDTEATSVVGSGTSGRIVAGFIGRVQQTGTTLISTGYLTALNGVKESSLFTVPRGTDFQDPNAQNESQARFTLYGESEISSLSAVGRPGGAAGDLGSIVAHASGVLEIHYRKSGGADFDDPATFRQGPAVATFEGTFQDSLTLQPPDFLALASVALSGHLVQKQLAVFQHGGKQNRLGALNAARTLAATGWGELQEPTEPRSILWIAGILSVVGFD
jgi:hypothetical protein